MDAYKEWKESGASRAEFLRIASHIPGIYVPSLYEVSYKEDGTILEMKPRFEDVPAKVDKQIVMEMSEAPYPEKPVVPFIKATQDRVVLEIMRGCIRGCRFCQAGMLYRPTRQKDVNVLKDYAYRMLKNTGHEEISLSSLSSSDYKDLEELVTFLIDEFKGKGINISLPSLRIDAFSLDVMSKVQDIRKSSLTFAPEAGSQRMRDVINKGLTQDVILAGATEAFKGGWNKVKLYFMLGLPGEQEEDIKAIAELSNEIAKTYYDTIPKSERKGKVQITTSTSFFVPKPFTPFQWVRMATAEEFMEARKVLSGAIKEQLNAKSIKYNWHDTDVTMLEGVFARGDRRCAALIEGAYKDGCLFDSWSEYFRNDIWMNQFTKTGLSLEFYTSREREKDELLPWDFIDAGISRTFLYREYEKSKQGIVTPNCRKGCAGCGAAQFHGGVCYEPRNEAGESISPTEKLVPEC